MPSWKPRREDLALILLTVAALGLVCANEFIALDDPGYVYLNPMVQHGLSFRGILWAFSDLSLGMWLPLTWLSLQLDATLFGTVDSAVGNGHAWGFHLTNLLLHMANVVLLYRLLVGATGAVGRSFLVAALWAVHPLRVESVAWVTERKDVLCGFFFLLTLLAYQRYVRSRSWGDYVLVLLCFLGGLASKPIMVTLPFVLLLWDYWPLGRFSAASGDAKPASGVAIFEKLPLFLMAFAICFATFQQHRQFGALGLAPMSQRASLACVSYGFHLWKTLWPTNLAVLYPIRTWPWSDWHVLASLGLLLGITAFVVWQRRPKPYALVGWLWFVGVLFPVSGISQVGTAYMNDRFTYLPHIGLFIMLVWLVSDFFDRAGVDRATRVILSLGVLGFWLYLTINQVQLWRDTPTLLMHSMNATQKNNAIYRTLGGYYFEEGKLDLAESVAKEALHNTKDPVFHILLGLVYAQRGEKDEALSQLNEADDLDVRDLSQAKPLIRAYQILEKYQDVLRHSDRLLAVAPNDVWALRAKGEACYHLGERDEAIAALSLAARLDPADKSVQELLQTAEEKQ